jgi:iron complex transport system substrate-binding protein
MRAVFIALLLAAGCAKKGAAPSEMRERKDGLGRTVRLPPASKIARIVSLAPSSTEILFAVDAGARVVGVDAYSDYPPAVKSLERVGADVDPSLEKIVGLRPDVVFTATSANTQRTVETLDRLGVPVYVSSGRTLDDLFADVAALGDVVGQGARAAQLVADLRARLTALSARVAEEPTVRALIVVWPEPLVVAGAKSHVNDLLRAARGENVASDTEQPFPTYSLERVVARAPEVVVVGTHSGGAPPLAPLERIAARMGARRFRVEPIDGDLLFRPGPRVVDGAEALARILRPERP